MREQKITAEQVEKLRKKTAEKKGRIVKKQNNNPGKNKDYALSNVKSRTT